MSQTPDDIFQLLEEEGGLRVEEIADQTNLSFVEARELVHELWEENRVVSGPGFVFEADDSKPPHLE